MGPGSSIDPVWLVSAAFTAFELLVTLLLVMPMPSNKFRGDLVHAISHAWHTNDYIRKTAWVLLTLNSYYLYDCARNLNDYNKVYAVSCESRAMVLYLQRNAFISAGSIFLFLVMRRLLEIQQQLYTTRAAVKEVVQQLGDGSQATSPREGHEEQVQGSTSKSNVSNALRKLEREVSTICYEPASVSASPAKKRS